ncbi:MAG TPA: DUF397 domain-containing protein [Propionibacteriaceae bacterium]|jgi:hypothetical protein|nr:DUF397 domain-containing protein [Propionibacteriaceae bacterium]
MSEEVSTWRKASASGSTGCIEVTSLADGGIAVRDSKKPAGPVLSFSRHEWLSFLAGIMSGEFDDLV